MYLQVFLQILLNSFVNALATFLKKHGEDIVKDTSNDFDDVALKAIVPALDLFKF